MELTQKSIEKFYNQTVSHKYVDRNWKIILLEKPWLLSKMAQET